MITNIEAQRLKVNVTGMNQEENLVNVSET